jgi:hypothetical protein
MHPITPHLIQGKASLPHILDPEDYSHDQSGKLVPHSTTPTHSHTQRYEGNSPESLRTADNGRHGESKYRRLSKEI